MSKIRFRIEGELVPIPSSSSFRIYNPTLLFVGDDIYNIPIPSEDNIPMQISGKEGMGMEELALKEPPRPGPVGTFADTVKKRPKWSPPDGFKDFYDEYPRKIARVVAADAFRAAVRAGASAESLVKAAKTYAKDCRTRKTETCYIMHPATFLRKERWRDYDERGDSTGPKPTLSPEEMAGIKASYESGEYTENIVRKIESKYGVKII